ncbi:triphosphoribosyl-dephospho-CoA synthase [Caloramator mitchellensis]|uniref:triphosphoribosyl-dephospho-CoA synthase n=1 Tax=Caloramator mitchellensis TaxID=908809 RepID=UPI001FA6BDC1|nr:triphosphoribosyl-dephospho-CoA synthase [Caloramator mitchellensis]
MLLDKDLDIKEFAKTTAQIIIEGMILEVISHPSPGLVSPFSNGSHRDMDYNTFLKSTAALSKYMSEFVSIGYNYNEGLLQRIREVGILAEKDMFKATNGINTQKGILFLSALIGVAAGRCRRLGTTLDRYNLSNIIKETTKGIVERELKSAYSKKDLTNGERLYIKYGVEGIRGEVENGLPTVIKYGLPEFEGALKSGLNINDSLINALIVIISKTDDTTILNRKGIAGLYFAKSMAKNAIYLGLMKSKIGRNYIEFMGKMFINKNISPGGSADLVAATYIIYKLEKLGECI